MNGRPLAGALGAVLAGLLAAAAFSGCGRRSSEAPAGAPAGAGGSASSGVLTGRPGSSGEGARAEAPFIRFEDVTSAAGIAFRHVNGASGEKFMMETLGSGVCVFDADGDGRQDLYFVQSATLPGSREPAPPAALYRNAGGGRFEDFTARAGVGAVGLYGMACVAGDVDADGDRDLLVTGYGRNIFYRNAGNGTFADDTQAAGLADDRWSASATFFDADRDGDLDLYVTRYVDFELKTSLYCGENRPGYRTVCHPKNFDPVPDVYYRNRGDGRFEDRSAAAGILDRTGKGLGVVAGDVDDDGDDDLYVANDDTPNFLWRNRGDGTFDEIAEATGCALSEDGIPQAGMGTDMADYDGDGKLDLFVTNLSEETNELYRNQGDGTFSNATFASGLGPPSLLFLAFGTFFFDADHDGDLDLFVGNGHIIDNIALYSDSITFEEPSHLYRNLGRGRFDLPPAAPALAAPRVVRGAVGFDFDDDGDEDIVLAQNNRPAVLLRNDGPPAGHWIGVTLAGAPPNRDAIGARVTLDAGGRRQVRLRRTATSYASQPDGRLIFGLGEATSIEGIEVRWPGSRGRERFTLQGVDRYVTFKEGSGTREVSP